MNGNSMDVRHICTAEDHQTAQDTRIAQLRRICIAQATQNVRRMYEIRALQAQVADLVDALATIQEQNRRLAVLEHRVKLLEAAEVQP